MRAMAGAAAAIDELALIGVRQSVLTGNIRPLAALKLRLAGLGSRHLDLAVGAYGDVHEVRAELVPVARLAAGRAYGTDFAGCSTVLVGDTPLDVEAALATGARAVGVATGTSPQPRLLPREPICAAGPDRCRTRARRGHRVSFVPRRRALPVSGRAAGAGRARSRW